MHKAFSLIEILIATVIFTMVMLIATSTFTWAASYNSKLSELRKTSLGGRKVVNEISNEIRLANGGGFQVESGSIASPASVVISEASEVALLVCSGKDSSTCVVDGDGQIDPLDMNQDSSLNLLQGKANGIIIIQANKNKYIFYRTIKNESSDNFDFFRMESVLPTNHKIVLNVDVYYDDIDTLEGGWQRLNDPSLSMKLGFAGYAPDELIQKQQNYIEVGARAETRDYTKQKAPYRARFDLKTSLETRDYN